MMINLTPNQKCLQINTTIIACITRLAINFVKQQIKSFQTITTNTNTHRFHIELHVDYTNTPIHALSSSANGS